MMASQRSWYLGGVTSFVIPLGIQAILFPWLVAVQLQESAERLGLAQMSTQLPAIFLILFGGVLADRVDARKILIGGHLLAALPALALAWVLHQGTLSYAVLIVYALFTGAVTAFVQPARDSMLNRVAGGEVQKTVIVTMGLTFTAQLCGYLVASLADNAGAAQVLVLQAVIVLVGLVAVLRLKPVASPSALVRQSPLAQLAGGLAAVWESQRMLPTLILLLAVAAFYGGSFAVLNPLIVRDVYAGGADEISMSFAAFGSGTISMIVLLVARGGVVRQGRALLLSMLTGGLSLGSAAFSLPFGGYLLGLFVFGMSGGVAMSMGRTIMQEAAPEAVRARVMSVFSLANMGGLPLGAVALGYCAAAFGPLNCLLIAVAGVWLTALVVLWRSNLWLLASES